MRAADLGVGRGEALVKRRAIAPALGVGALALAFGSAVVAHDVGNRRHRLDAGDVAYRTRPYAPLPWRFPELLPGSPARRLLGVGDDLAFRVAVWRFRFSRPENPRMERSQRRFVAVLAAERDLARIVRRDTVPARRSTAANLLGVLAFEDPDPDDRGYGGRSLRMFRRAVMLDPANEDAKRNLELLLRLSPPQAAGGGGGGTQGRIPGGGGAGIAPPGSGY